MLAKIKLLLGIDDLVKDNLLEQLILMNSNKILTYLGIEITTIPVSLEFIVIELTIKQYNKLGSEGLSSESIEGISYSYSDSINELEPYMTYIEKYMNISSGKFRFL